MPDKGAYEVFTSRLPGSGGQTRGLSRISQAEFQFSALSSPLDPVLRSQRFLDIFTDTPPFHHNICPQKTPPKKTSFD